MKSRKLFFTTVGFLFLFLCSGNAAGHKKEKVIKKSFPATVGSILSVDNKFGIIDIKEWDKNEVSFDVLITVEASDPSQAQELMDKIRVDLSQSGNVISGITRYEESKGNCNNCRRTVDYRIMVPKTIHYRLENKYGNISMQNAKGNAEILLKYGNYTGGILSGDKNKLDVKYGNIDVKGLTGNLNEIETKYGERVSISSSTRLKIQIMYSKLKIENVEELNLHSGYSDASIQKAARLTTESKYGTFDIGEVDFLIGSFSYANLRINKLNELLSASQVKYGEVKVNYVAPDFNKIEVDASYSPIEISPDKKASFRTDVGVKHGNINIRADKTEFSVNTKEQVKGTVGSGTPKGTIILSNKYGNVSINQK